MSDADRKRLVAILGMLGSASAGERDNAARLAEQFRRQHGLTWEQLFEPQTWATAQRPPSDRPTVTPHGLLLPRPIFAMWIAAWVVAGIYVIIVALQS